MSGLRFRGGGDGGGGGGVTLPAFLPSDWAWLSDPATEGTVLPLDTADWVQSLAGGSLTPQTLAPTLAADSRSIELACPIGYGAYLRPQVLADGSDVCILVAPLVRSGTGLNTGIVAEVQAIAIEAQGANNRWVGCGPRWSAVPALSTTAGISMRGQATAATGLSGNSVIGSDVSTVGLVASRPVAVRLHRSGNTILSYFSELGAPWRLVATSNAANFDPAAAGMHVGVRVSCSEAQRVVIWAYAYFAPGALP